jgi:ubiquinone/menaquinone biosynthesis C-methylase UbiE
LKKALVWLMQQMDIWGSVLSSRLVKWTGKSPYRIHPKHFLHTQSHHWYLSYIDPFDVILDVGCGNGMHTIACASHCREAYGFDHNPKQLGIGETKVREEGIDNVCLAEGNAEEDWDYPDAYFDKVMILDVLEHVHRRDFVLKETRRVLKASGRMLLSIPQRNTSWKNLRASVGLFAYADPDHKIEYTRDEIEEELARNGFTCEVVDPIVYDTWLGGLIDLTGGISLKLYGRLAQWKRDRALQRPSESSGFRILARVEVGER